VIAGDGFRLRPATEADLRYLVALAERPEVADSLAAVTPWDADAVRADLATAAAGPGSAGRFVIEVDEGGAWRPAGALAWETANRRSRIAYLHGVMVAPEARGRGLGSGASRLLAEHLIREVGFHRVQLEVYGFNERALRAFERAGFVREGVRRRAYDRHGAWVDGVLFGLLEDDLGEGGARRPAS
jgi:RimJ/RimL family protein N-acetyltransferase